jgi:AGCS family alanine or glycine:cation symporter
MVAILEPFIDTIVICTITGLVLLSSGVWNQKIENRFEQADLQVLDGIYSESNEQHRKTLGRSFANDTTLALFSGDLQVEGGQVVNEGITLVHAESFAEDVVVTQGSENFTGTIPVENGVVIFSAQKKDENGKRIRKKDREKGEIYFHGKSLIHSAPLTTEAFKHSILGDWGQYIVSIGLLLFAFSTAISWSYYGGRAVTYLWGTKYVIYYRFIYVIGFFVASFTDTTIVWNLSYITIAIMTIPNLFGLLVLQKDIKNTIRSYWSDFKKDWPMEKLPIGTPRD